MPASRTLRRRRAAAQLLRRPEGLRADDAVRRLLAVQAQELRSARLALRARVAGLTAADVDRALTEERSLVVAWLGRGTLHLVHRDDYPWLFGLSAPGRLAPTERRMRQEGVSAAEAERGVELIEAALAAEGPLTRPQLGERLEAAGVRTEGQALPHLLALAALRGGVVLGPVGEDGQAFALTRDWLGTDPPAHLSGAEREPALAELARRYLAAHAPADAEDLARWAGVPLGEARVGWEAAAKGGPGEVGGRLPARLLPSYDPYLLGWREREFAVPAEHAREVHPGGGILRATAVVEGLAVGTWSARRGDGGLTVEVKAFAPLSRRVAGELEAEAADVARFQGLPFQRFRVYSEGID